MRIFCSAVRGKIAVLNVLFSALLRSDARNVETSLSDAEGRVRGGLAGRGRSVRYYGGENSSLRSRLFCDFNRIKVCVCFASGSQSEDLLWNDYEEKLSDQVVRTMENYTSQFPEVKVRISLQH